MTSVLLLCVFLVVVGSAVAQTTVRPSALVLPVTKDNATLQYVTSINQRTPLVRVNFTVDLGASFLWVDCATYTSSSYAPGQCGSNACSLANSTTCGGCYGPPVPGCYNNSCALYPSNTIIDVSSSDQVGMDVFTLTSTNGSTTGQTVTVSNFIFSCAPSFLLTGLAGGVTGMAGFGRNRISLPNQLASAFTLNRTFAVCLPSSITAPGPIFFGEGPYILRPNETDVSLNLTYTPLLLNPVTTASVSSYEGAPSDEYFINVTSINVNNVSVPLNTTLLPIKSDGLGGTRISTVEPYTMLDTSIYRAVTDAFVGAGNFTLAPSVMPFGACFDSSNIGSTPLGPAVPEIELVLGGGQAVWRITGANSVVSVNETVMCLAFVDSGPSPRSSITIGGRQIEDNLLQFDLANARFGFSSTLLAQNTSCSNFNFA